MRGSLADVRRRVERLAAHVTTDCGRQHVVHKISKVWGDDPVPNWPGTDAPQRCDCGREIEYRHIVLHLMP